MHAIHFPIFRNLRRSTRRSVLEYWRESAINMLLLWLSTGSRDGGSLSAGERFVEMAGGVEATASAASVPCSWADGCRSGTIARVSGAGLEANVDLSKDSANHARTRQGGY